MSEPVIAYRPPSARRSCWRLGSVGLFLVSLAAVDMHSHAYCMTVVTQGPTPNACVYQWDDGSVESQVGLTQGGQLIWMVRFDTRDQGRSDDTIRQVGTAWGGHVWPQLGPTDGDAAWLFVWDDLDDDGDPRTGTFLFLAEVDTQVANANTDIVNFTTLPQPVTVSGVFFVGASINHLPNEAPAPGDQTSSLGRAWLTGNDQPNGFDPTDLSGPGSIGVYEMDEIGFPMLWLTRAIGDANPLSLYCFGDGSGAPCPCANHSDTTHVQGCQNSTGVGAALLFSGDSSVAEDDFVAIGTNLVPQQPALLFAGHQAVGGGAGLPFGDGLRCVGSGVVRLGVRTASSNGAAEWGPGLAGTAGIQIGDTRYFQIWYRDPSGSPCGSGFNLSSAAQMDF